MAQIYVVKVKKNGRWKPTFWTRGGKPVLKRAAEHAAAEARQAFPAEEYDVREVKPKKVTPKL